MTDRPGEFSLLLLKLTSEKEIRPAPAPTGVSSGVPVLSENAWPEKGGPPHHHQHGPQTPGPVCCHEVLVREDVIVVVVMRTGRLRPNDCPQQQTSNSR